MTSVALITELGSKAPAGLRYYFESFKSLYEQKLWHPLSVLLIEFFKLIESRPFLERLYDDLVVKDIYKKLSPISMVQLTTLYAATLHNDTAKAISLLEGLRGDADVRENCGAFSLATTELAYIYLQAEDLFKARDLLEESEKILAGLAGLDYQIHASQYRTFALLAKKKLDYTSYFNHCLSYLNIIPKDEISMEERYQWVHSLVISALLSDKIYHFGELLMTNHLSILNGSPTEWYNELILSFNAGKMSHFEAIIQKHANDAFLTANLVFLKQKQSVMSLVDCVFQRPLNDRRVAFSEIASVTNLPIDEVEFLIMKTMALGLIKGYIDQVEQCLIATWVQARVLNKDQVGILKDRITQWQANVKLVSSTIVSDTASSLVLSQ